MKPHIVHVLRNLLIFNNIKLFQRFYKSFSLLILRYLFQMQQVVVKVRIIFNRKNRITSTLLVR